MRLSTALSFAAFAVLAACSSTHGFTDGGTDATMESGTVCHSNADCDDHVACTHDSCLIGNVCQHQADNTLCPTGQSCTATGCGTATRTCHAATDCDDHIMCTRDTCLVDMTCQNRVDDTLCPVGQSCDAVRDCTTMPSHCTTAADCNDMIDCTMDTCGADGTCSHTAQNSRCPTGRTCSVGLGCVMAAPCGSNAQCDDHVYCNGVETCNTELACVSGTPVNCDDTNACTVDTCNETTHMCDHMLNPTCMGMMGRNGNYNVTPIMYSCMDTLGLGMTVINLNVSQCTFVFGPTSTMASCGTSSGGMGTPPMTGPAISGMMFTVSGIRAGDCNENYALTGTFSDATHFTGTLTLMLTGATCGVTDCTNQSWPVTGTLVPGDAG